jgi:hypothetical protein
MRAVREALLFDGLIFSTTKREAAVEGRPAVCV